MIVVLGRFNKLSTHFHLFGMDEAKPPFHFHHQHPKSILLIKYLQYSLQESCNLFSFIIISNNYPTNKKPRYLAELVTESTSSLIFQTAVFVRSSGMLTCYRNMNHIFQLRLLRYFFNTKIFCRKSCLCCATCKRERP